MEMADPLVFSTTIGDVAWSDTMPTRTYLAVFSLPLRNFASFAFQDLTQNQASCISSVVRSRLASSSCHCLVFGSSQRKNQVQACSLPW